MGTGSREENASEQEARASPRGASAGFPAGALCFSRLRKIPSEKWNLFPFPRLSPGNWRIWAMLVERGVRVLNMGVVGDAYAIAANYLRRTGAIPDDFATCDRLLEII